MNVATIILEILGAWFLAGLIVIGLYNEAKHAVQRAARR